MIGLVDGNNFFVSCERVLNRKLVGQPVAVLSNNDGCCVALSPELKAMGVKRGTPYFQLRDRESQRYGDGGIIFLSSNFELYGDMSRRIISVLRDSVVEVEQYSIDEAFITPPSCFADDLYDYGVELREKILRWVGIPCGVGFAPTKTLAKIANHIGKKRESGVFVMDCDPTSILADLPTSEVWGVGRRLTVKLRAEQIFTALDLRDAPDDVIRSVGGVSLLRTALELRGMPCCTDRDYDADPFSISCSRSFGQSVTKLEDLTESIASFTASAAEKLRRHNLLASGCNIYAQYGGALDGKFTERTVVFPHPTDATNEMIDAIVKMMPALFIRGERYRKSGMVFFGLEKEGTAQQLDLFEPVAPLKSSRLFQAIDRLNGRFGKASVSCAAEGIKTAPRAWSMRRNRLSLFSTTDWSRLPTAN